LCICVDDDLVTALIYKCIIEGGNFDDPDYSKYFIRGIISTLFDVIVILLVALG
jgi:hypothetical protein